MRDAITVLSVSTACLWKHLNEINDWQNKNNKATSRNEVICHFFSVCMCVSYLSLPLFLSLCNTFGNVYTIQLSKSVELNTVKNLTISKFRLYICNGFYNRDILARLYANKGHALISHCTSTCARMLTKVNNGLCLFGDILFQIWTRATSNTRRWRLSGLNGKCSFLSAFLTSFSVSFFFSFLLV